MPTGMGENGERGEVPVVSGQPGRLNPGRQWRREVGKISVRFQMKRSAKVPASPPATRTAVLYTMGKPRKIKVVLPVATPEELLRSLRPTRTALQRVERAIAKAGLRRKAG